MSETDTVFKKSRYVYAFLFLSLKNICLFFCFLSCIHVCPNIPFNLLSQMKNISYKVLDPIYINLY